MPKEITAETVRQLLSYDPETGILRNRVTRNVAKAGDVAGFVDHQGYRVIKLVGGKYSAARLIWLYMTGNWPAVEIDHINRIRDDDRFVNLREADRSQNCSNKRSFNTTNGFRGVKNSGSKFQAAIRLNQKDFHIGTYWYPETAALAYDLKAVKMHGSFAMLNFPASVHRDWLIP